MPRTLSRTAAALLLSLVLPITPAAAQLAPATTSPSTRPTPPEQLASPFFSAHVLQSSLGPLPYRLLAPLNPSPAQRYPLVLFLHGSGEVGTDNLKQLKHGMTCFLNPDHRANYPVYVVVPQCPPDEFWTDKAAVIRQAEHPPTLPASTAETAPTSITTPASPLAPPLTPPLTPAPATSPIRRVLLLLDHLKGTLPVDPDRVYVMGLSMGGFATFDLLERSPETFAAAVPICGGGDPALVSRYAGKVPVWVFHGAKDDAVLPDNSRVMVAALRATGGPPDAVRYTEYPNAGHASWYPALAEPDLLPWLLSHRRN